MYRTPRSRERLWFCYADIGLLVSDDGGQSFGRSFQGMKHSGNCFTVVVDPQRPSTIWAATGQWSHNAGDICRSDDGGRTWQVLGRPETGLPDGQVKHLVLDPVSPVEQRRLLATVQGPGSTRAVTEDSPGIPFREICPPRLPSHPEGCCLIEPTRSTLSWRLRAVEREGDPRNYAYRFNLVRDDFAVGTKAVVEYTIGFADMPETFPGQILSQHKPLKIGPVTPSADQVSRYGKLELTVELDATYENPFDPAEVRLDAIFTSPSGQEQIVPGFFLVEHRREVHTGSEVLLPEGHGAWKIRFAPRETGRYSWRLSLRDRSGEITGGPGVFQALPADRPGFVRVSRADPHYFAFDNGQGYFPIGHNLPIYHTSGQLGDEAMRKFAEAKENFNRWWMSASGFGIEWMGRLGWYRQDAAARLDLVLDQAQSLGLYYMLCMDTHQDFREQGWELNPFNAKNGGPCKSPADWFTNETARKHYRNRLRYTVARWGYSPHVCAGSSGTSSRAGPIRPRRSNSPGTGRWPTTCGPSTRSGI